MTDDEIRAIFDELRRVGADLGRPPGLALGTGFEPGQFLVWLRSLPDALGHDAFAERLGAHVSAAAPLRNARAPHRSLADLQRALDENGRWWPSRKQLELGVDLLLREWDPLGARLGTLEPEIVDRYVFEIIGAIIAWDGDPRREVLAAEELGEIEERDFLVRRSPVEQRRYLARRLCAIVDENPAPPVPVSRAAEAERARAEPSGTMSFATAKPRRVVRRSDGQSRREVALGPTGFEPASPLDPTATCADCGRIGTVAFVTRDIEPRVSRYCRDCWKRVRTWAWDWPQMKKESAADMIDLIEHVERMSSEQIRSTGSAVWEDHFAVIERFAEAFDDGRPLDRQAALREWARGLADRAGEMDGPMPPKVEAFVREHGGLGA